MAEDSPGWTARARAWAEHWPRLSEPARLAVADAVGLGPGVRVLDAGCGTGEFCALALARGAEVSGIDVAEGMLALARERAPEADLPLTRRPHNVHMKCLRGAPDGLVSSASQPNRPV